MTHPLASRLIALTGLALCLALLASGSAALPYPPLHPAELLAWWSESDPALALGALVRMVAMTLSTWLIIVTACETVATLSGLGGLARVVGHVTPAAWRILVLRPLAVGTLAVPVLFAPTVLAPAIAAATDAPVADGESDPPVLTMTLVADPTTTTSTPTPAAPTTTVPTTTVPTTAVQVPNDLQDHMQPPRIEMSMPGPGVSEPAPTHQTHDPNDATAVVPADVPGDPATSTATGADGARYVIASGDSFWSIAAQRVEIALGRVPTSREIGPYWRDTVALNADRLPVPGNPDLLFPGDEVLLPPL